MHFILAVIPHRLSKIEHGLRSSKSGITPRQHYTMDRRIELMLFRILGRIREIYSFGWSSLHYVHESKSDA